MKHETCCALHRAYARKMFHVSGFTFHENMNLLPPQEKEKIQRETMTRLLSVAGGILVFWTAIFLVLLYNSILFLNLQIPVIEERLQVEQNTQKANMVRSVEDEIGELNEVLIKIEKIRQRDTFNFPYILRVIGSVVPEGAELRSITFQKGNMAITGHADERAKVLEIKDKLEEADVFKDINSPLSNIVKERDISFIFNFSINE